MNLLLKKNLTLQLEKNEVAVDFTGNWINEHGSTMQIAPDANGVISGEYETAVGQPGNTEKFPIIGYATGKQIAFVVNFGAYGSITAWTGQLAITDGKEVIYTLWHMSVNVVDSEEEKKLWESVFTGYDNFNRDF